MTHDPVRDEAERLVAAAIAALSFAARGIPRGGARPFATGSDECCVCPICRLIASMRDPNADLAERLASGAGDLAAGVASLLRAFGHTEAGDRAGPGRGSDFPESSGEGEAFWESLRERARADSKRTSPRFAPDTDTDADDDDAWYRATKDEATKDEATKDEATKDEATKDEAATAPPPPPRPMAKKAVKKAVKKATKASPPPSPSDEGSPPDPAKKKMNKKAAKKAAPRASTGEE